MLGLPARDYFNRLNLSPDGKRVVLVILEGGLRHIWVYDTVRGSLTRLTFGDSDNASPTWSPSGRRIAYASSRDGNSVILTKPADGSGSEETLLSAKGGPSSWSTDGKFLAYSQSGPTGKWEIWVLPLEGERKPQPLLTDNQFDQVGAVFSPDGKYLAYTSNESGRYEVYVRPFRQGIGKWQISTVGGANPVWARSGKQLFYSGSANIMGVDVTTQPVFSASTPRVVVPSGVNRAAFQRPRHFRCRSRWAALPGPPAEQRSGPIPPDQCHLESERGAAAPHSRKQATMTLSCLA